MKFYEKLLILIVLFLGVTIGTAGIIGTYVATTQETPKDPNRIVLDDVFVS